MPVPSRVTPRWHRRRGHRLLDAILKARIRGRGTRTRQILGGTKPRGGGPHLVVGRRGVQGHIGVLCTAHVI
ncbi:unnamed protein product [Linum trigynum]|uniref:Uncharacterized protein n=1 Tax=Linum trigynum TaxID=586398 RepID=A0AAV2DTT3_9ROSI